LNANSPRDAGTAAASGSQVDDGYRLISIRRGEAPGGSTGRDWHVYRIQQGANVITGYRRGDLAAVTQQVEQIIVGLNERRLVRRGRVHLTSARPASTPGAVREDTGT
jgi:hypothetical protein